MLWMMWSWFERAGGDGRLNNVGVENGKESWCPERYEGREDGSRQSNKSCVCCTYTESKLVSLLFSASFE